MEYRSPHLISSGDLFCNYDVAKLKGKGNIKRKYKCSDKKTLAKQIFLRYLHIMFADFMQGGKTFMFPSRRYLEMRMRRIPQEQFKSARKVGAYADVDIIASGQMCWEAVICYKISGLAIEQPVKVSKGLKNILIAKVNEGYKYC